MTTGDPHAKAIAKYRGLAELLGVVPPEDDGTVDPSQRGVKRKQEQELLTKDPHPGVTSEEICRQMRGGGEIIGNGPFIMPRVTRRYVTKVVDKVAAKW